MLNVRTSKSSPRFFFHVAPLDSLLDDIERVTPTEYDRPEEGWPLTHTTHTHTQIASLVRRKAVFSHTHVSVGHLS